MKNESQALVRPARNVRGSVQMPGDKSISHRYAMLAGIAEGAIADRKLFDGSGLREHARMHALDGSHLAAAAGRG